MTEGTTFVIRDKGIRHNAIQAVQCRTGDPLMVVRIKAHMDNIGKSNHVSGRSPATEFNARAK